MRDGFGQTSRIAPSEFFTASSLPHTIDSLCCVTTNT